ncbi:putative exoribonuclease [Talaromyces proteolyticus]|uniref:Exoribonuclease n=1 Tax=Talaromyces proteolyticus TaxID=1131652 RepID=A0AAD4L0J4_9EURO|nr:putative exoribonuclease [Talaromyces proteolyticus]KAH8705348.1 putative exoribonuclease [Talaromyces proteolyticus]
MEKSLPKLAIPGQQLAPTSAFTSGPGTHIHNGVICASIAGPILVEQRAKSKSTLTISRSNIQSSHSSPTTGLALNTQKPTQLKHNTLPAVDSIVLARVTRVQKRQVTLSILVVLDPSSTTTTTPSSDNDNLPAILTTPANPENHNTADELRFQALIRKEDVRAVEKDRVVLEDMFRVGDVVRGSVISLGDQSFYYLTTARNDLGVVMARSEMGNMMFPVSWKEMRDPVTGVAEARKVARPF